MSAVRVISPDIQKAWSWPAVMLFTLVGIGCGLYLSSAAVVLATFGIDHFTGRSIPFGLLSALTVLGGFFFVFIEAGRPLKSGLVFTNVKHSWMSRELSSLVFFLLGVGGDILYPSWPVKALALGGAFMLIVSQGFMLYKSKGIKAWNVPMMPALMILSAIASGCGVLLLSLRNFQALENARLIALALSGGNFVVWVLFAYWICDGVFLCSTRRLGQPMSLFLNLLVGQLVPCVLLVFVIFFVEGMECKSMITTVSGITLVLGGFLQKSSIVVGAGFSREIVLNV